MIFLTDCNLLFLKPRKVGGTSFEIALSKYANADDIITPISIADERTRRDLGSRGAQNYTYGFYETITQRKAAWTLLTKRRFPRRFYNHVPAADVMGLFGEERFSTAFKTSIIRNPFDVLVSKYYWHSKDMSFDLGRFHSWLENERNERFGEKNDDQYFVDGRFVIDHLIRFEHFKEDILSLEKKFPHLAGLEGIFSSIKAKGGYRPRRADTAAHFAGRPDLVEKVVKRYEWVFEKFDYHTP